MRGKEAGNFGRKIVRQLIKGSPTAIRLGLYVEKATDVQSLLCFHSRDAETPRDPRDLIRTGGYPKWAIRIDTGVGYDSVEWWSFEAARDASAGRVPLPSFSTKDGLERDVRIAFNLFIDQLLDPLEKLAQLGEP